MKAALAMGFDATNQSGQKEFHVISTSSFMYWDLSFFPYFLPDNTAQQQRWIKTHL
jgi:hypothetical protein